MNIAAITLTNVGPFRHTHKIDLTPSRGKPIILVGGMNGAGKTTLFKSILIGFYGQGWEGPQGRQEYEQELHALRHKGTEDSSSIEIAFTHTQQSIQQSYVIKRSWKPGKNGVIEDLQVTRNGQTLSDVDQEHWPSYVRELIPRGVSSLFFFDGEKIKDLAEDDEAHALALRESFDAMLGLDVVEQLREDLTHVMTAKKDQELDGLQVELAQHTQAIEKQRANIQLLVQEREHLKELSAKTARQIDRLEGRLAQRGGLYYQKRDEYKAKAARLEEQIRSLQARLVEMSHGTLPFLLAPTLVRRFTDQLYHERRSQDLAAAATILREVKEELVEELKRAPKEVAAAVTTVLDRYVRPPEVSTVLNLSRAEADAILEQVGRLHRHHVNEAKTIAFDLKKARAQLEEVQAYLTKVPKDNKAMQEIREILVELADETKKRGHLEAAVAEKASKIEEGNAVLDRLMDDRERVQTKLQGTNKQLTAWDLAARCRIALKEYQDELRSSKVRVLQDHLKQCLRVLTNKPDSFGTVTLDGNLHLSLKTKEGKLLQFAELSAGERQVIATALLWALSKTSERPLPFIIDTPLGRLDSKHREHLLDRFYPNAGNQVVILSTDTEIDAKSHQKIRNKTARTYRLVYDPKTEATSVEEGYFGGRQ